MATKPASEQMDADPVVFAGEDAERFLAEMNTPNPEQAARVEQAKKAFDDVYSAAPANALFG